MSTMAEAKCTDEQAAARNLVALYAERIRLSHEFARSERPTGAMADQVLKAGRVLDEACEVFRRRFYPRGGRVVVGLYAVMLLSPKGQRTRTLYDGFGEYAGERA